MVGLNENPYLRHPKDDHGASVIYVGDLPEPEAMGKRRSFGRLRPVPVLHERNRW